MLGTDIDDGEVVRVVAAYKLRPSTAVVYNPLSICQQGDDNRNQTSSLVADEKYATGQINKQYNSYNIVVVSRCSDIKRTNTQFNRGTYLGSQRSIQ